MLARLVGSVERKRSLSHVKIAVLAPRRIVVGFRCLRFTTMNADTGIYIILVSLFKACVYAPAESLVSSMNLCTYKARGSSRSCQLT